MSAIDTLFAQLRASGRKAFMPFITAGDPDLDFTAEIIRRLTARGCHLFELGIPYSDPIADGPVIQASFTRALDHKIKLASILESVKRLTPELQQIKKANSSAGDNTATAIAPPLVSMMSYSIIFRHGPEKYVVEAKAAGVAGAIVPDLPVEESGSLAEICRRNDFSLIQLITPTTPRNRALQIAAHTTGFIYYVSVSGITGERTSLPPEIVDNVAWLRSQTPLPICIGFGISKPEHVRILAPVADGLIVGSAIVRRMAEVSTKPREQVIQGIEQYAGELLAALQ
jgi:tryptophan synthase alpha chain